MGPHRSLICTVKIGLGATQMFETIMGVLSDHFAPRMYQVSRVFILLFDRNLIHI